MNIASVSWGDHLSFGEGDQLWPMRRGTGYVQDDLSGRNLPSMAARGIAGLVFSTFRYDNPDAVARGDWTAGRVSAAPPRTAARSSRRSAGSPRA